VDIHDHSVSVAFAIAKTYLGIKVTSGTWAPDLRELSPRPQILSSPYALQSGDADTLGRGKVAVGTGAAAGQVVVNAKTSIGSGYTATAAPANGLIVEGPVGIGTSNLGGAKARISGGVLNVDSQLGAQSATIGSGYYLTYGPPSNGLIVQGNVGVGVSVPSEKLEVNGRIKDQWGYVMPVGAVLPYAGTGVPSGWLLCDGSPVSRSTYATLFGVIGVQYGAGNGSTTFNLPDLRGRVVVGYNGSDGDFNAVGKVGGEKAHVLSYNEMPRHKHSAGDIYPNDDNSWIGSDPYGWGDIRVGDGDGTYQCQRWYDTSLEGWNYAHNNLQPYITLLYIIKY
jgi:microcystin-dependent protein